MKTSTSPYTGKRILIWFVGFFLVVFSVNGTMAYFALKTWTGLETENSYVKGLNYNDEIESAAAQQKSGWNIAISGKPKISEDRFEITLTRPEESLPPAEVTATFIRAVTEGYDQKITLSHNGGGVYGANVKLPLAGQWNVLVVVKSQNNLIFKLEDEILVK
tara:strand:- start:104524 stop:105009 length:486 start_codon:yes stop_codon:yes gene_type:complete